LNKTRVELIFIVNPSLDFSKMLQKIKKNPPESVSGGGVRVMNFSKLNEGASVGSAGFKFISVSKLSPLSSVGCVGTTMTNEWGNFSIG
jgi:hypothetical protein